MGLWQGYFVGVTLGAVLGVMASGAIAALPSESLPSLAAPQLPHLGPAADYLPQESRHLVLRLGERRVYVYRRDKVVISYPGGDRFERVGRHQRAILRCFKR